MSTYRTSLRPAVLTMALAIAFALFACNRGGSDVYPDCGYSVGTCHPQSTSCGIQVSCKSRTFGLVCTPPTEPGAKQIECTCVDNSVPGKKVQLAFGTAAEPFSGNYQAIVKTACGF